jgi:zinc protease
MRNLTLILFGIIVHLFTGSAWAGLTDKVSETVLSNGLKVILLENHKAPLVTFQVWYRVGSRNESWGKTGLSHMLEHMMFKGTKKIGGEQFSRIIEENGGNYNAFTSKDFTAYFENLRSDRIQVAIDLEADRMRNLVLRDKDFQTERMVVMEERRLRTEDNPRAYLFEQMTAAAFTVSPYHWPIIGWMEDIRRFTLADLQDYYQTYYQPANAFLVVVGDFKKDDILFLIRRAFGGYTSGVKPDPTRSVEPQHVGEKKVLVKKEAQLPFLVRGFYVPNLQSYDSYVLEVIAAILSGGKSSRFYREMVREKQVALEAHADHSLLSHDPSLFYISVVPMPGKDMADLENAVDRELERLQNTPVTDHEIEKAKNRLEASFIYSQDSLFSQAMLLARHEIAGGWKKLDDYLPFVRKVTAADIQRVSKRYLIRDNSTVGILVPLPVKEGRSTSQAFGGHEEMIK